jgi:hypothetical protein
LPISCLSDQSLSHPGGNITGFAYLERTIGAKWLALLTEIAPGVKHVAFVFSPKAAPYAHFYYETAQAAASHVGFQGAADMTVPWDSVAYDPFQTSACRFFRTNFSQDVASARACAPAVEQHRADGTRS